MIGSINCTYETPCGWCSKWDKKCDRKIGTATPITGGTVAVPEISINDISGFVSATATSSNSKKCGGCKKTDGMVYTSNPPQVKCAITGRFHFYDDVCDCESTIAKG